MYKLKVWHIPQDTIDQNLLLDAQNTSLKELLTQGKATLRDKGKITVSNYFSPSNSEIDLVVKDAQGEIYDFCFEYKIDLKTELLKTLKEVNHE